eukprot:jgi/Mesvir1/19306/Mv10375-RA.1
MSKPVGKRNWKLLRLLLQTLKFAVKFLCSIILRFLQYVLLSLVRLPRLISRNCQAAILVGIVFLVVIQVVAYANSVIGHLPSVQGGTTSNGLATGTWEGISGDQVVAPMSKEEFRYQLDVSLRALATGRPVADLLREEAALRAPKGAGTPLTAPPGNKPPVSSQQIRPLSATPMPALGSLGQGQATGPGAHAAGLKATHGDGGGASSSSVGTAGAGAANVGVTGATVPSASGTVGHDASAASTGGVAVGAAAGVAVPPELLATPLATSSASAESSAPSSSRALGLFSRTSSVSASTGAPPSADVTSQHATTPGASSRVKEGLPARRLAPPLHGRLPGGNRAAHGGGAEPGAGGSAGAQVSTSGVWTQEVGGVSVVEGGAQGGEQGANTSRAVGGGSTSSVLAATGGRDHPGWSSLPEGDVARASSGEASVGASIAAIHGRRTGDGIMGASGQGGVDGQGGREDAGDEETEQEFGTELVGGGDGEDARGTTGGEAGVGVADEGGGGADGSSNAGAAMTVLGGGTLLVSAHDTQKFGGMLAQQLAPGHGVKRRQGEAAGALRGSSVGGKGRHGKLASDKGAGAGIRDAATEDPGMASATVAREGHAETGAVVSEWVYGRELVLSKRSAPPSGMPLSTIWRTPGGEVRQLGHMTDDFRSLLPEEDPSKAMHFGTCAVVGSGGILLSKKFGREISSHDAVIRFNAAPIKGYEEFVGNKTTVRLVNRKNIGFRESDDEVVLQHVTLASTLAQFLALLKSQPDVRTYMVDPAFYRHAITRDNPQPTSGYLGLLAALQLCDRVDVYGFVRHWQGWVPYHYYNDEEPDKHQAVRDKAELPALERLLGENKGRMRTAHACGMTADCEGCSAAARCEPKVPFPVARHGFCLVKGSGCFLRCPDHGEGGQLPDAAADARGIAMNGAPPDSSSAFSCRETGPVGYCTEAVAGQQQQPQVAGDGCIGVTLSSADQSAASKAEEEAREKESATGFGRPHRRRGDGAARAASKAEESGAGTGTDVGVLGGRRRGGSKHPG